MRSILLSVTVLALLLAAGCSKAPAPTGGQQATVMLNDGTSFAGTVTKSSTTEISLTAANGEARTYPMSQVSSVQYAGAQTASNGTPSNPPPESTPAASAPAPSAAGPAPAPVSQTPPPAVEPPASEPTPMRPAPAIAERKAEPVAVTRTVRAGTTLMVRNNALIDSKTTTPGQTYSAVIARDVMDANGRTLIPSGSNATLVVRTSAAQGKVQGQSELALALDTVTVRGKRYRVETDDVVQKGHEGLGTNKRTGVFTGGGAVLGTLLGAVAGGGRGAAIGAVSGGAAGVATQTLTRGKGVKVAAETMLTFRLEAPIHINEIR